MQHRISGLLVLLIVTFAVPNPAEAAPEMVTVPAGVFIMGDGTSTCGINQRTVTLTRDFDICRHEVTNQEFMEALQWAYNSGYVTASTATVWDNLDGSTLVLLQMNNDFCEIQFNGAGIFYLRQSPSTQAQTAYPSGYNPASHPALMVTWYGAARYCDWLSLQDGLTRAYDHNGNWACHGGDPYGAEGYRLPTDAEWEYAAQYDDERIYPWGNQAPTCSLANSRNCVHWTAPAETYPGAPQALGLTEMAGNIFEWCNDWHVCELGTAPAIDPAGPGSGTYRVIHGGCWDHSSSYMPNALRPTNQNPNTSSFLLGFRAARTYDTSHAENQIGTTPVGLLAGNAPNPFVFSTSISFRVPASVSGAPLELRIYNPAGRLVRTLIDSYKPEGSYCIAWNGADNSGVPVAPGVYFYRLQWNGRSETQRMILAR
ncbi:MAG: SUMF1/EgtB/PvdO family nonheme iron enzyme [Candidatus Eisenbacteria bacterium]|uniref:SUMF1/EgtB/PvdO family nonheme iron enzyme n=1 Tax=Eiseniibacteriota bacterium TaxID=2212470 RepID=A0A948RVF6_UNCEI|nr:SUMF1/EgtB/PvdO family nonheme iron enzyme [Candidatus Eisenbacteria bacterium]MBU1950250.1 SUMF1/EgtB/PvdO family nonheme iron enzyme [Candidatus Eisenbacteria bacterium]MBU2690706.1 SUMF1/EgtB/PvdO family nonheme iron enzyme [Candidatus Eisenbacteria bacterium]